MGAYSIDGLFLIRANQTTVYMQSKNGVKPGSFTIYGLVPAMEPQQSRQE